MIEKLVAALAATVLGSLLLYAFKLKQLYLVVPRLFSSSFLSTKGKLIEVRIFNRGKGAETDVQISFDPAITYEIIASTDSTCALQNSTVQIPRISPGDDYSVLLHVEGGDFNNDRIAGISSATTKGKVLKDLTEVPPNAGNAILGLVGILLLAASPVAAIEGYEAWQESKAQQHESEVVESLDNGWSEIGQYTRSKFSRLYALGEFPIHFVEQSRMGERVLVKFRIVNRAAAQLDTRMEATWEFSEAEPEPWRNTSYKSTITPPVSNSEIEMLLFWPKGKSGKAEIEFQLSVGEERYLESKTEVEIDV